MSHARFSSTMSNNWETLFKFQIFSGHLGFRDGPGYPQMVEISRKMKISVLKDKNNLIMIYHMPWFCKQRVKLMRCVRYPIFVGHLGFFEAHRGCDKVSKRIFIIFILLVGTK